MLTEYVIVLQGAFKRVGSKIRPTLILLWGLEEARQGSSFLRDRNNLRRRGHRKHLLSSVPVRGDLPVRYVLHALWALRKKSSDFHV